MTAKQKLAERIEKFSEEEAEDALALLGPDDSTDWPDFPPASPKVMEMFSRAMAESEAGRVSTDEKVRQRFGIE